MKKSYPFIVAVLVLTMLAACAPMASQNPVVPDTASFIGEEKAKAIALEHFGIEDAEGINFRRTDLDYEKGTWVYELEFRQGAIDYDIDIKADDGTVVNFEKDIDD